MNSQMMEDLRQISTGRLMMEFSRDYRDARQQLCDLR